MKNFFTIFASVFVLTSWSFACDIHGKSGFMPKNNLYIPTNSFLANDMSEEKFNSIIGRVINFYAPIIKEKGGVFSAVNRWDDGTVNAYAFQSGNRWVINMFGGLARHPLVTEDGLMLVACHETGHHLGGAPKYAEIFWSTNEGQADYFAALKCMRRVLENDDNITAISKMQIDQEVIDKCELVYKAANEVALCKRIAMAGKSVAQLVSSIGDNSKIAFNTPDKKVTKETEDWHPDPQCRLDTFFSASLCDKSASEEVSETDPVPGTCVKKDGYTIGVRPLCWYRPGTGE